MSTPTPDARKSLRIQSDGTDIHTVVTLGGERLEWVRDYTIDHPLGEVATATVVVLLPQFDVSGDGYIVGRFPCCGHEIACPHCG